MRKLFCVLSISVGLLLAVAPNAAADMATANFTIALDGSTVPSNGTLTLTLQADGTILGALTTLGPTGSYFINLDFNIAGVPYGAANGITFSPGPSCDATCYSAFEYTAYSNPIDEFGEFNQQLDTAYVHGDYLTSFDFYISRPVGFTSVSQLLALSESYGSGCTGACGAVDFQLFTETPSGLDIQGAVVSASSPAPEPSSFLLFGTGLLGLGTMLLRRKQSA